MQQSTALKLYISKKSLLIKIRILKKYIQQIFDKIERPLFQKSCFPDKIEKKTY